MDIIQIRKLNENDFGALASLHKKLFDPEHFTSQFSEDKLEKYFRSIWRFSQYTYAAYDKNNSNLIGYLFSGENVNIGVRKFLLSEVIYLTFLLLKSPKFLIEKFRELFLRDTLKKTSQAKMRLYLIAALSNNDYKGVGKLLINNLENDLKNSDISLYGLSVRIHNSKAINFYHHLNFREEFQTKKSIYLIKNIN